MKYEYEAIDQAGMTVKSTVDADSVESAVASIRNLGHYPIRLRKPKPTKVASPKTEEEKQEEEKRRQAFLNYCIWVAILCFAIAAAAVLAIIIKVFA